MSEPQAVSEVGEIIRRYEDVRRAAREYAKAQAAFRECRERLARRLSGSRWECSVVLNKTVPGAAAPTV